MYFSFIGFEDDMAELYGYSSWNRQNVEVVQRGSQTWTGTIIAWSAEKVGRRAEGAAGGQWQAGDTLTVKACAKNGSHIETSIRSYYLIICFLIIYCILIHCLSNIFNFPVDPCSDGEQNGYETGVDCGGECDDCVYEDTSRSIPWLLWAAPTNQSPNNKV